MLRQRIIERLKFIYPSCDPNNLADLLMKEVGLKEMDLSVDTSLQNIPPNFWDQTDVVLITYGDSFLNLPQKPLKTLRYVLDKYLKSFINIVHILPFFPYSSDDGFSVLDYQSVNPLLGDWCSVTEIAQNFRLMSDLVINHMSSQSQWFKHFKQGLMPYRNYFIEVQVGDDISKVVRPRSSSLLTKVLTKEGECFVWCTFSSDQVDLNFKNPQVLCEFVRIIRFYLEQGVRLFRLDAVAFLWKEFGTDCIHLQQTHELIKLLRLLVEHHTPGALIITETNVPNRENLTYFGNANEAHMVYNFSLPPLLIHTLITGSCKYLKTWMMSMPPAQMGTCYLNFIASHDGIGLRPADDLLDQAELNAFIKTMSDFGGQVSCRKAREGYDKPYEINISLMDALKGTHKGLDQYQYQRYLCAHTIMLGLEGIPAFYVHSLLGTENDHERVRFTGQKRAINRHQWSLSVLEEVLSESDNKTATLFTALKSLIELRRLQPAFHPNATQYTLHLGFKIFAFWRQSLDRAQSIFCIHNISDCAQKLLLVELNLISTDQWYDLLSNKRIQQSTDEVVLAPYQSLWLTNKVFKPQLLA